MVNNRLERIEVLRFPLIVLIVLLHSDRSEVVVSGGVNSVQEISPVVEFIKNLLSQGVARAAVPLFFYVSGFLYFARNNFSKETYVKKTKARIFTIVIPIIFWNAAILFLLGLAQSIPATASYFSGNRLAITDYGLSDYFTAFTGIGGTMANAPFWFLRDLLILSVSAPIIYWIARSKLAVGLLSLVAIAWFFDYKLLRVPTIEASFYFILGAFVALKVGTPFVFDRYAKWLIAFTLVLLPLNAYLQLDGEILLIHKLSIVASFGLILFSTRSLENNRILRNLFNRLAEKSFFVYAAHGFLLGVLIKLSYKIAAPVDSIRMLFLYFLNPFCTVVICLIVYKILWMLCPRFLVWITGARTRSPR